MNQLNTIKIDRLKRLVALTKSLQDNDVFKMSDKEKQELQDIEQKIGNIENEPEEKEQLTKEEKEDLC